MTEKDLDSLESAAKAATPGPWRNAAGYKIKVAATGTHCASAWSRYTYETGKEITDEQAKANATYIATANPAAVLELIAELRKGRAERYWLATRIALDGVSCPVEPNVCAATCADHIQCWLKAASDAVEKEAKE